MALIFSRLPCRWIGCDSALSLPSPRATMPKTQDEAQAQGDCVVGTL